MSELSIIPYILTTKTNTLVRKSSNTSGDYFSYKRHIASTTLMYGSRPDSLYHHVPQDTEYEWPRDGYFISPAIPLRDYLSDGRGLTTRVYNRIDFLGGIYNSAVVAGKSTSWMTTSLFSTPMGDLVDTALDLGYLTREEVYDTYDNGEFKKVRSWKLIHRDPNKLMRKLNKMVYDILYVTMPSNLLGKDMQKYLEITHPDLDLENTEDYPSLLDFETVMEDLPKDRSNRSTSSYLNNPLSESLYDGLMLYHYAWDSYMANTHPVTREPTIMATGSNDPVPVYGRMQLIMPEEQFNGYILCRSSDVPTIQQHFSYLFHIGTLHNTNEVQVSLKNVQKVELSEVENMATIVLELPSGMDIPGFEISEIYETTDRYQILQGKYSGEAYVINNHCIPNYGLIDFYLNDSYKRDQQQLEAYL